MPSRFSARRIVIVAALVALLPGLGVSAARADTARGAPNPSAPNPSAPAPVVPRLAWKTCGTAPPGVAAHVQCAVADLPLDYDRPGGAQVHIAVAKVPARDRAHRIGSLFFDFGGPGVPAGSGRARRRSTAG
jgi:hypothetical protein